MLRPEWRLWPLSSFLGLLDLKTGVTVALLFAVSRFLLLHTISLHFHLTAPEQSSGCIRPHRSPHRCRGIFCSTQSLHLLCHRPSRPRMGLKGSKRGVRSSFSLHLHTIDLLYRKTQNTHYTLPTYSSPITSFPPAGLSSSPLYGGSTHRTTVDARPTPLPRRT